MWKRAFTSPSPFTVCRMNGFTCVICVLTSCTTKHWCYTGRKHVGAWSRCKLRDIKQKKRDGEPSMWARGRNATKLNAEAWTRRVVRTCGRIAYELEQEQVQEESPDRRKVNEESKKVSCAMPACLTALCVYSLLSIVWKYAKHLLNVTKSIKKRGGETEWNKFPAVCCW